MRKFIKYPGTSSLVLKYLIQLKKASHTIYVFFFFYQTVIHMCEQE